MRGTETSASILACLQGQAESQVPMLEGWKTSTCLLKTLSDLSSRLPQSLLSLYIQAVVTETCLPTAKAKMAQGSLRIFINRNWQSLEAAGQVQARGGSLVWNPEESPPSSAPLVASPGGHNLVAGWGSSPLASKEAGGTCAIGSYPRSQLWFIEPNHCFQD